MDPINEAFGNAMGSLASQAIKDGKKDKKKEDKKWDWRERVAEPIQGCVGWVRYRADMFVICNHFNLKKLVLLLS